MPRRASELASDGGLTSTDATASNDRQANDYPSTTRTKEEQEMSIRRKITSTGRGGRARATTAVALVVASITALVVLTGGATASERSAFARPRAHTLEISGNQW